MKSISASIIVAAGAAVFLGGMFAKASSEGFGMAAGSLLVLAGLFGWV